MSVDLSISCNAESVEAFPLARSAAVLWMSHISVRHPGRCIALRILALVGQAGLFALCGSRQFTQCIGACVHLKPPGHFVQGRSEVRCSSAQLARVLLIEGGWVSIFLAFGALGAGGGWGEGGDFAYLII